MHHVTTRSIAEEWIFRDGGDYATGIRILAELVEAELLVCHSFCFMPTHYHVFGSFNDLSVAIHKLNRRYAVAYNRRYRRRGHVFDSPFSRKPVETREQVINLALYIALNPEGPLTWPYGSFGNEFSFVDPWPIVEAFGSLATFRDEVALRASARDVQPGSANQVG